MKSQNNKEILNKYFAFIGYFTALLFVTVLCAFFYLETKNSFANMLNAKKAEVDLFQNKTAILTSRMDSLNTCMSMLNTKLVANEDALERRILKLKTETLSDIEEMEKRGNNDYYLYKRMLMDVEKILETKKMLQEAQQEEDEYKRKLLECNKANIKLRKRQ